MPESHRSLHLSNPSLQAGSTRSPENEILRSETLPQMARDVSKLGVSESRSVPQWPAKSRTCRGLLLRLKTYQKQLVSVVEPGGIRTADLFNAIVTAAVSMSYFKLPQTSIYLANTTRVAILTCIEPP
jgi:hypothetical protein